MAAVGSMQEASQMRKERLKALREKHGKEPPEKVLVSENDEHEPLPKPVFRSYKPADEGLKESVMAPIKPADVTEKIEEQLVLGKDENTIEEIEITNLAPRKPDWDLKRDIAKKLEKLERRTQKAIAELIRERLKAIENDLVTMVNDSTEAELASHPEEED